MSTFSTYIRKHAIWIIILIGVLPFFVTIDNGFLSDSWEFLHIAKAQPFTLERMLLTNTQGFVGPSSYRPMVNIYWGVMYHLFGVSGTWYHLSILALYMGSVYLLYATLRRSMWLGTQRSTLALVVAAGFAWNPVRVSSLAWVSIVNDTMLVFFVLLSWYLFTRYLYEKQKRWYWYLGALVAGVCAIGSKEVGVTLPIVIGAMSLLYGVQVGTRFKQFFRSISVATLHALPFFFLIIGYMLLRRYATGFIAEDYTGSAFVWFDGFTVRSYISMFVSFFVVDPIRTPLTQMMYAVGGWVAVVVLYLFATWIYTQKQIVDRYVGGVLVLLTIFVMYPVSRFGVNFLSTYITSEGERYAYYPSVFVSLCIVWFFRNRIIKLTNQRIMAMGIIFALAIYSTISVIPRITYWEQASEISRALVEHTVDKLTLTSFDEVVFIGLPDMLYGAYIWRNAFTLRLTTFEDVPYTLEQLKYSDIRTVVSNDTRLMATRYDDGRIVYQDRSDIPTIVGPINSVQYGYESVMPSHTFELLSISHTNFATSTTFTPANANSTINRAVFLFDGRDDWIVYEQ